MEKDSSIKMKGDESDLWVKDSLVPQGRGIWKGIQQQKHILEEITYKMGSL